MHRNPFDLGAFARALEERDAELLTDFYADDAEIMLVDGDHPPATPRVLRGRHAIADYHRDICGRDMTHRVTRKLLAGDHAAVAEECRYPDGTNVLALAVLDVTGGSITSQLAVQAWDES
jgi:ketosteroid isomerase-like protein